MLTCHIKKIRRKETLIKVIHSRRSYTSSYYSLLHLYLHDTVENSISVRGKCMICNVLILIIYFYYQSSLVLGN